MSFTFVIPSGLPGPSGGNVYNDSMISALKTQGVAVRVEKIAGAWPSPATEHRTALAGILVEPGVYLIDGIIALAAPETISRARRRGSIVHVLVHSLLSDTALDQDAAGVREHAVGQDLVLQMADSVICTSDWSRTRIKDRTLTSRIHVVTPGCDPASLAAGSTPPQLLMLGAITRVKNQLALLSALTHVTSLPWRARLVGSHVSDPTYAQIATDVATRRFTPGRITLPGVHTGDALEEIWQHTDLLVVTSITETFGMVITEALAHGIPAIAPAGTGATEALTGHPQPVPVGSEHLPGAVIDVNDQYALARELRRWLSNDTHRADWQSAALQKRAQRRPWQTAATELKALVQR